MRGFVFFQIVLVGLSSAQQPCIPPSGKPGCVCDTADGTIDLSSLSNTDGTARFTNIQQSDGNTQFVYSYNPCITYYEGTSSCSYGNAAACQSTDSEPPDYYMLGDSSTETMYVDSSNNNNYLQYDNGQDERVTIVYLTCDPNADTPIITADGDGATPLTYIYHLTTKCACPGGCGDSQIPSGPPTKPGNGGGGGGGGKSSVAPGIIGIVLVFVMLIGFVTYFVVGAVVMNRKFEKEGKEMIPQKDLWFSLPFLVKDGCVFTFRPLVNLVRTAGKGRDDYENIK